MTSTSGYINFHHTQKERYNAFQTEVQTDVCVNLCGAIPDDEVHVVYKLIDSIVSTHGTAVCLLSRASRLPCQIWSFSKIIM